MTTQHPARRRPDPLAVAGLVLAFLFWPVGLPLSLVALDRTIRGGGPGRGLALAGIAVSAFLGFVSLLAFEVFMLVVEQAPDRYTD